MQISLKAARVNKQLTQAQAAKALGIAETTLANYEKGKTFPDTEVLKKIEKLYGVTYNNLSFT